MGEFHKLNDAYVQNKSTCARIHVGGILARLVCILYIDAGYYLGM